MAVAPTIRRVSADPTKRREMTHFDLASDKPPTYPATWFEQHPNEKPSITVHIVTPERRGKLHSTVRLQFATGELSPAVATAFLWHELTIKGYHLDKKWESFGRIIGLAGSEITVANLADVKPSTENLDLVAEDALFNEKDLRRYVVAVACVLRIIGIDNEDYRDIVIDKMNALITQPAEEEISLIDVYINYKTWVTYPQYPRCMAFADMYLAEFPDHPLSSLRMGSIVCRMRDCATLVATFYILKMFGMTIGDFALWIWTKPVAVQYDQVTVGGQEMDQPRSYALYFRDLGLSDKSPYSAPSNADLHLFLHALGVTEDSERSVRARFVGTPLKHAILANAMVLSYVQEYSTTGVPLETPDEEDEDEQVVRAGMPDSKDPDAWLGWLQEEKGVVPNLIKKRAYLHWLNHADARPGTIGELLYKDASAGNLLLSDSDSN